MAIWAQRIRLGWRQSVSFYEHRYEVLRALEDDGSLRRFQDKNGQISMRLGGAHQLLSFGANGFSMAELKPGLDEGILRTAAEVVCSALQPEPVGRPSFGIQSLVPLDLAYDDARKAAGGALLPGLSDSISDFALLLDGVSKEPVGEYRLESGILTAQETPARLARAVGRVGLIDNETPPALWQPRDLPDVALFCDIDWKTEPLQGNIVESLFATLKSVRDASDGIVSSFVERLDLEQQ